MKKMLSIILAIALLFAFTGCGTKDVKTEIFDLVEKNYEAITKACEERDVEALSAIDGVTQVKIVDRYVIVYCKGAGIALSSEDYGFYYSAENSPIAVDCSLGIVCNAEDLSPEGDGYQCVVSGNTFYTEHIKGNVYFYSNAY